ncbi:MAG: 2-oxoglutarate dehydrogenase complex dihydrolipoyllysine-residue succinyltransferase [Bacteroidota bacterium]|nr:2-oxoglutarate dehydrogenase complex dihydrolipoyllysine-residue succinyltransferase [Bacteroidota bacterium]
MSLEIKIPSVGESVNEVTIASWLKKSGEYVEMDEPIAELETDKATVELNAPEAGILKILVEEGEDVEISMVVAELDTSAKKPVEKNEKSKTKENQPQNEPSKQNKIENYATGVPSPAAKKILAEKNITTNEVVGSGKNGRITKADALSVQPQILSSSPTSAQEGLRTQKKEKMSKLRKTVSRRLVEAKNQTAMLTTFNEADMSPIMNLRKKYKEKFKEVHQVGLGFMSFFTRASSLALQQFPSVNAYIDGDEIIFNDFTDISIAVSGPKGLMVPVIRNAEIMSMWEIEKEVLRLASKARDGKLTIDEMTGGTFTISNGGVFGSMLSTPIINPPQSAILGMHNIIQRPIAVDGKVEIRPMMYLALSYDHRIIDGRESVTFLKTIKTYLENPEQLITGRDPMEQLLGF